MYLRRSIIGCPVISERILHIGKYFDICHYVMQPKEEYWFRGHSNIIWPLRPSALRYKTRAERNKALKLISDFKRFAEIKLSNPPLPEEELKWVQIARHYGLPTRLLDWTRNAAIALYFACRDNPDMDGGVFILNPVNLNRQVDSMNPRVFDAHSDATLIKRYLRLLGEINENGTRAIAIYPVWNSERIMLQQGVFTIAGSRYFTLTSQRAPGLACIRIKQEYKESLLEDLDRVGVNEMSIFPEPEHTCKYLVWKQKL